MELVFSKVKGVLKALFQLYSTPRALLTVAFCNGDRHGLHLIHFSLWLHGLMYVHCIVLCGMKGLGSYWSPTNGLQDLFYAIGVDVRLNRLLRNDFSSRGNGINNLLP